MTSVGAVVLAAVLAAVRNPFLVVDGDGWLTSNADYNNTNWLALDVMRPAFGLQLSERNDLPFDRGTAGATFWVRNSGCEATFGKFGDPCGWQLGLAITQFRSIVVGGQGMEIDGLGLPTPYMRVVNSNAGDTRLAGLLSNTFVDFSGVDRQASPSWFAGFDLSNDRFSVRRAAPGSKNFVDLLTATSDGIEAPRMAQEKPDQWASRLQLEHGRATFKFATAFGHIPVCVASPEGTAHVRVAPALDRCVVTSDNPNDTSMVDIIVVGNPS